MSKKVTTKDFINRAQQIHGNKYDYTKTTYIAAIKNLTIICPIHGEFQQRPANHLSGRGCRKCGGNEPIDLNAFKERAKAIHQDKFDYSQVSYKNVEEKINIICPEHGVFSQRVMTHLKGFNCPKCGRKSTSKKLSHSLEKFLHDATIVHGKKYDYSKVEYKNAQSKVTIICPIHGEFQQRPANHVRGIGCSKCSDITAGEKRRLTTDEYIEIAKLIHQDRYDYSKVVYSTSHEKVEIICPEHGSFWQSAVNHIKGNKSGCPGCAMSGFDQTKPATLYYIAVITDNQDVLYKIGITNNTVKKRFPSADLKRIRVIKTWEFEIGSEAAKREISILRDYSDDRYIGEDILIGSGNTELFVRDILELDMQG